MVSDEGGQSQGGGSRERRKQMYSGCILKTELADLAKALNLGLGRQVSRVRKETDASLVSDLSI